MFDRWWVFDGTVNLTEIGITANNGFIGQSFSEYIAKYLNGKVITFSVFGLVGNSPKCVSCTLTYNIAGNPTMTTEFGVITVAGANSGLGYFAHIRSIPEGVTIQATKLELGPVQTLAHKEGDTWVLNGPPPDYGLELAKCQRFYFERTVSSIISSVTTTRYGTTWFFPVCMRTTPAITIKDSAEGVLNKVWISGVGSIDIVTSEVFVNLYSLNFNVNSASYAGWYVGYKIIANADL